MPSIEYKKQDEGSRDNLLHTHNKQEEEQLEDDDAVEYTIPTEVGKPSFLCWKVLTLSEVSDSSS
jgi:hypothetical protein